MSNVQRKNKLQTDMTNQTIIHLPVKPKSPDKEGIMRRFRQWLRANMLFGKKDNSIREALVEVLEESQQASVEQLPHEEKKILRNVLEFGGMTVRDVMIPRTDIQAVEYHSSLDELTRHIVEQRHTRIPVYEETLDHIKGFIHIKDLFPVLKGNAIFDVSLMIRDILFVPPSMKILDLLVKMRLSRVHIAIVVDEMGGTDGLVTMENLFEEIVGEIEDEHDEQNVTSHLIWSPQRTCDVDARTEVVKIEKELGIYLYSKEDGNPDDFDTIGGLIFFHAGRIPAKGEKIDYQGGIQFEILDGDARRIKRLRIIAPDPLTASSSL